MPATPSSRRLAAGRALDAPGAAVRDRGGRGHDRRPARLPLPGVSRPDRDAGAGSLRRQAAGLRPARGVGAGASATGSRRGPRRARGPLLPEPRPGHGARPGALVRPATPRCAPGDGPVREPAGRLELGGITYHLAPEILDAASAARPQGAVPDVRLLPGFDEFLLGYGDRSAALAPEHAQAVVPGSNGMFLPTIVIDGEVVGTWKRVAGTREAVIRLSPFGALPDDSPRGARGRRPGIRCVPGQGCPDRLRAGDVTGRSHIRRCRASSTRTRIEQRLEARDARSAGGD